MAETFVDLFLEHTKIYESPTSFWQWTAYTTIAAVLRDNCFKRMGDQRIFPSVYTLLLAESAMHRKGHPVKICEELVKSTRSTKLISGRSSIQGILDELARAETDKTTGKIVGGGSALFIAPELSAGIVSDPEAIKILTDIYDFKDEYTSRLRGSGIFRVKNICFSMMAASNAELLQDVYDSKALFGGLLGRTFLVKPDGFRPANSLFNVADTKLSFDRLAEKLKPISLLKGEFQFTDAAVEAYDNWYVPFREASKYRSDKSGIAGRIHTSVIKLAMIICVNDTVMLTVQRSHIVESIYQCMKLLPNYSSFIMSSGKSTVAECAAVLIEEIWKGTNHFLTKEDFLSRFFHQYDADLVNKTIETLDAAGFLKAGINQHKQPCYGVTTKCIDVFKLKGDANAVENA